MIFAMRDGQRAREDLNQMLQTASASALAGKSLPSDFISTAAHAAIRSTASPASTPLIFSQALGDFPLIGMFGGYELAPLGRANHLFAYTGVLALITE